MALYQGIMGIWHDDVSESGTVGSAEHHRSGMMNEVENTPNRTS